MSRSKKGKKGCGWEYWGKRPLMKAWNSNGQDNKRHDIQRERAILKRELLKEPHEPEYNEQEYEPPCELCAKGICPVYDKDGNQVGVNGDYE